MQYRRLGAAGMKISVLALGGWINFEAKIPQEEARRAIRTAYEGGINFYDLADVYGQGEAERWMGRLLRDYPRPALVISSKVCIPMSDDPNDRGLSRKHIMESIDRSLRNLGTDYLDIYFCHRPDPDTPLLETARAMDDLIHAGKVLYWGTSTWSAALLEETVRLCDRYGLHPPQAEQPQYSMLHREPVEHEILPAAAAHGIGLTVYSPLAMGMLTGKYDEGIPTGSRFDREPWATGRFLNEDNARRVRALRPLADGLGISRAQLALAWALRDPGISSVITGVTTAAQVQDNLRAAEVTLDAGTLAEIDAILAG